MLSWITTFPIAFPHTTSKKRRLRRPLKISAPIRQPSGSMNLRRSTYSEHANGEIDVDSGAFYLVPNKTGTGKTIVRRHAPPSTSPLPTNIDTTFLGATLTSSNTMMNPAAAADGKRPKLAIRTTSPLTENNDSSTIRQATPKSRFDPMRAFRNSFRGRPSENGAPENTSKRWKGKEKEVFEQEGDSRKSKVAAKTRYIREWMKGKSGLDTHRSTMSYSSSKQGNGETSRTAAANNRQIVAGGVRDLFKNRRPGAAREPGDRGRGRGPKAGQTYEIVNRRVVENNPERTVEISTWRELDAAQESKAQDQDDKMSIYYISADEYPVEGEFASDVSPRVEWRSEGPQDASAAQSPKTGSLSNRRAGSPKIERREGEAGISNSRRHRTEKLKTATSPVSLSREGTISPSTSEKDPEAPPPPPPPRRLQNGNNLPGRGMPSSSTPIVENGNGNHSTRIARHRGRHKENEPPQSPFHPTESGSTISSIKSESTVEFEAVLQSCEPSLLHIAPILQSLGIRQVEHMRAVARLTPSTRDREVKEDALRLGITVMEWAIFVDRMLML